MKTRQTNIKNLNSLKEEKLYEFQKELKDEMEICIMCGKETKILKNLHIDMRNNYIEGAGQLCYDCARDI